MSIPPFKIFVSSPGDVVEERVLAGRVIDRLRHAFTDRIAVQGWFWEHEPLHAAESFQAQIPRPSEADVVVCILWRRLGTRLPVEFVRPDGSFYQSGTEFEFEDAIEGWRSRRSPHLLVYRKTSEPLISLDDPEIQVRLAQKEALEQFLARWFQDPDDHTLLRAFHPFATPAEFEDLLARHVHDLVARSVPQHPIDVPQEGVLRASWTSGSPYRGLSVFRREHAPIFFGRTRAISDVLEALRRQAEAGRPFVMVLGMSGGGKSSLVQAGVVPMLMQPGVVARSAWRFALLRPGDGDGPLESLAAAMCAPAALPELVALGHTPRELAGLFRDSPASAVVVASAALRRAHAGPNALPAAGDEGGTRLVLVVDQFEELFSRPTGHEAERRVFVRALAALVETRQVWVIASMRSDFFHRAEEIPELVALKEGAGQYHLPPPTAAELGQMVRHPAWAAGLSFEIDGTTRERLDDLLKDRAVASPGSLPLLEFLLEELYLRRTPEGVLTHEAYHTLGGLEGAVASRAEAEFNALVPEQRETLPEVFASLVQVSDAQGVEPVRRLAPLSAFADRPRAAQLVDAFVQARLFVADRSPEGEPVVTLAHEALLHHWPRLSVWVMENREDLRTRRRLAEGAAEWVRLGREADALYGGAHLAAAEDWASRRATDLTPLEREFLQSSIALREREAAEDARRHQREIEAARRLAVTETLRAEGERRARVRQFRLAGVVLLLGILGTWFAIESNRQGKRASSRAHAAEALARVDTDPEAAVELALRALDAARTTEAGDALRRSLAASRLVLSLSHPGEVMEAVYSPDGSRILTVDTDSAVRLWDATTGRMLHQFREDRVRPDLAFSGDGQFFVTGTGSQTHVWNRSTLARVSALPGPPARLSVLSRDGQRIFTGGYASSSATIWNTAHPERHRVIRVAGVNDAMFTPDGRHVLTVASVTEAAGGGRAQVWAEATGAPVGPGHAAYTTTDTRGAASLSQDGNWVVTVDPDQRAATVWDLFTGRDLQVLRPRERVSSAVFSPVAPIVVTTGGTHVAILWDAVLGTPRDSLVGEVGALERAFFSADGRRVIAQTREGRIQTWDIASRRASRPLTLASAPSDSALGLVNLNPSRLDPTGVRLLTFRGRSLHVVDLSRAAPLPSLRLPGDHRVRVEQVAISSGGQVVATASVDGMVRVWEAATGRRLAAPPGHTSPVLGLAFSSGGRSLVTADERGIARIWALPGGEELATVSNDSGPVRLVSFAPDDGHVLIVQPTVVRLWVVAPRRTAEAWAFRPAGQIVSAAVSRDRSRLLVSDNSQLYLLDLATGDTILSGPGGRPVGFAGDSAIFTLMDGTVQIHDMRTNLRVRSPAGGSGTGTGSSGHRRVGVGSGVKWTAFSPDGRWLVTTTEDYMQSAFVWSAHIPLAPTKLKGHWVGDTEQVEFSPDGNLVLAAPFQGMGGAALVFDAMRGDSLWNLGRSDVLTTHFSPDGRFLVTGHDDGNVHLVPYEMYAPLDIVIAQARRFFRK